MWSLSGGLSHLQLLGIPYEGEGQCTPGYLRCQFDTSTQYGQRDPKPNSGLQWHRPGKGVDRSEGTAKTMDILDLNKEALLALLKKKDEFQNSPRIIGGVMAASGKAILGKRFNGPGIWTGTGNSQAFANLIECSRCWLNTNQRGMAPISGAITGYNKRVYHNEQKDIYQQLALLRTTNQNNSL